MPTSFILTAIKTFKQYKAFGDKAIERMPDDLTHWQSNEDFNSMSILIKHVAGNMISRWTDFLTTDGEKPSRDRDLEFEHREETKAELIDKWNQGWECLFTTLESLSNEDLEKIIYIRAEAHTVQEAIIRQMAHYPYHIGQMVFLSKMMCENQWETLSIPRRK
jgi:uncharacterized damage-inducible protein DinB